MEEIKIKLTPEAAESLVAAGVSRAMTALGMTSGEISKSAALRTYGKWFKDACEQGRLKPVRTGGKAKSTKWYSVDEIYRLKAIESNQ